VQRKAYVSGVAALLAALLAGCTGGSSDNDPTDDANPGSAGTASAAAEPGRYRTLPEPCTSVGQDTLDSLLPGILQISDEEQQEKAYAGEATHTFDTDRKVGCRWKVESAAATDHLLVDFERVVSYDTAVSDDDQAEQLFATEVEKADLPVPVSPSVTSDVESGTGSPTAGPIDAAAASSPVSSPSPSASSSASPSSPSSASSATSSPSAPTTDLQPRLLDGLGDEAFLDDALSRSGSTAQQRTVTVAFRTSNVIVTIEYEEQPATVGVAPDSKEMQDKAQKLAAQLADTLAG
jgi:hypothetical protein